MVREIKKYELYRQTCRIVNMYMFEERDFSKGLTLSPLDVIYYFVISVSTALGRVNFTCSDLDVSRTCKGQSAPIRKSAIYRIYLDTQNILQSVMNEKNLAHRISDYRQRKTFLSRTRSDDTRPLLAGPVMVT